MLVKYAVAFVIMPGGLGTLDELTEILTLMQTHKIKPFPVILFNSEFWKGFLDWLAEHCLIQEVCLYEEDFDLLRVLDHPDEVVEAIRRWYVGHEVIGREGPGQVRVSRPIQVVLSGMILEKTYNPPFVSAPDMSDCPWRPQLALSVSLTPGNLGC